MARISGRNRTARTLNDTAEEELATDVTNARRHLPNPLSSSRTWINSPVKGISASAMPSARHKLCRIPTCDWSMLVRRFRSPAISLGVLHIRDHPGLDEASGISASVQPRTEPVPTQEPAFWRPRERREPFAAAPENAVRIPAQGAVSQCGGIEESKGERVAVPRGIRVPQLSSWAGFLGAASVSTGASTGSRSVITSSTGRVSWMPRSLSCVNIVALAGRTSQGTSAT